MSNVTLLEINEFYRKLNLNNENNPDKHTLIKNTLDSTVPTAYKSGKFEVTNTACSARPK